MSDSTSAAFSTLPPDLVLIGHAARDLLPGGGWRLGGAVTFAGLAAHRLGLRIAIVTSTPPDIAKALAAALPTADLRIIPAREATTFTNVYQRGERTQHLLSRAEHLNAHHVPAGWEAAPLVLLAPIAQEVNPEVIAHFPSSMIAATGQGWLRTWDAAGLVSTGPFAAPDALLASLCLLSVSTEDLAGAQPDLLTAWTRIAPLVTVTHGAGGADVLVRGKHPIQVTALPAVEVDPTGAGDVFAVAMLVALWRGATPEAAARFACQVAALSVEAPGLDAVPTRDAVLARYPELVGSPLLG